MLGSSVSLTPVANLHYKNALRCLFVELAQLWFCRVWHNKEW